MRCTTCWDLRGNLAWKTNKAMPLEDAIQTIAPSLPYDSLMGGLDAGDSKTQGRIDARDRTWGILAPQAGVL